MELNLYRIAEIDGASIGVLTAQGKRVCFTLEQPWRDNARDVSCIPPGVYELELRQSPRFGLTYEVAAVPGRSHILFHAGNTVADTRGCILPGLQIGDLNGQIAVLRSRWAMARLMELLQGHRPITLTIDALPT